MQIIGALAAEEGDMRRGGGSQGCGRKAGSLIANPAEDHVQEELPHSF
jgi:hypothetical protein